MGVKKVGKQIANHFQSGVSYIIPLVVAAGLLTSIAIIFGGSNVGDHPNTFWGVLNKIGGIGLDFIVPMISAYIAYSIADRPGLAPAFITGMLANEMGTGFLGGMLTGLAVGYLIQLLKKIPMPAQIQTLKSLFIIPLIGTAVVGLLLWYVIGTPVTAATDAIESWLNGMSGANAAIMGAILGGMMAFDMGGPLNKIAYAFGVASFSSGGYDASTAMLMAIAIPPLGMFLGTLFNKKLYEEDEIENGRTAAIMGLVGITEGTIPFAVKDPLRVIPSIMVGTAVACALNGAFGITHQTMLSTVMAIPFTTNPFLYTIAIIIGSLITAFMVNILKSIHYKKNQTEEATE